MAEREGFEPPVRLPVLRISSAARSTTLPPLRMRRWGRKRLDSEARPPCQPPIGARVDRGGGPARRQPVKTAGNPWVSPHQRRRRAGPPARPAAPWPFPPPKPAKRRKPSPPAFSPRGPRAELSMPESGTPGSTGGGTNELKELSHGL